MKWLSFTEAHTCVYWLKVSPWLTSSGTRRYIHLHTLACTVSWIFNADTDSARDWMMTIIHSKFSIGPEPSRRIMFFPPLLCVPSGSCTLGKLRWYRRLYLDTYYGMNLSWSFSSSAEVARSWMLPTDYFRFTVALIKW